jgi:hypothetical protein
MLLVVIACDGGGQVLEMECMYNQIHVHRRDIQNQYGNDDGCESAIS